jgi:hypothetical protein
MGFFSDALVIYIGLILVVINTVIFVGRYAYTVNLRDPTVWSRRRFVYQDANPTAAPEKKGVSGTEFRHVWPS